MSREAQAGTGEGICPTCRMSMAPRSVVRSPLDLRFCTQCGMLIGVAVQKDRLGKLTSPLPGTVLSISLKAPGERPPAAIAGPPRPPAAPPAPVRAGLAPAAPGTAADDHAAAAPAAAAIPPASGERPSLTPPPVVDPGFGYPSILLGDPSETFRQQVRDLLLVSGVAEDVTVVRDGGQLVTEYTRGCRQGAPPDLVVLDSTLPLMDGKNVAILLRSIEDAFSRDPVPILFYTAREPDAAFTQLLGYLKNARHLLRDASMPPEGQAQKLAQFLSPR